MKYADINKRFTDILAGHLKAGYTVNTSTATINQGELTKLDLANGTDILRPLLRESSDGFVGFQRIGGVEILGGKAPQDIRPNREHWFGGVRSNQLQIVLQEKYYCITGSTCGVFRDGEYVTDKNAALDVITNHPTAAIS